jgi:hypothetical protein
MKSSCVILYLRFIEVLKSENVRQLSRLNRRELPKLTFTAPPAQIRQSAHGLVTHLCLNARFESNIITFHVFIIFAVGDRPARGLGHPITVNVTAGRPAGAVPSKSYSPAQAPAVTRND